MTNEKVPKTYDRGSNVVLYAHSPLVIGHWGLVICLVIGHLGSDVSILSTLPVLTDVEASSDS